MIAQQKGRGKALPMPVGILIGSSWGIAMMIIMSVILTWLIHSERASISFLGYASMGILFISGIIGALGALHLVKRRKMLVCLLSGSALYGSLLSINALLWGGHYQGALVTGIMVYLGSFLPLVPNLRSGKKIKKKYWR